MLNIGMTELLCFAIIVLLVLGPEKLPEAARFAAKWYGKGKRFIHSVQTEVDRELKLSEFREEIQKEIDRMTEIEQRLQKQLDHLTQSTQQQKTQEPSLPLYTRLSQCHLTPFSANFVKSHGTDVLKFSSSYLPSTLKIAV
ncbi:Sec-independent protein translocase protein TatB [Acinetobacter sp. ANC 5378]|uniref:Sec-independent protein translocase protein TatB n=1 Tax=Acinetobacter sp. ANC 5378 TaxID=2731249 RepID=UPI00149040CA|nr:Sec-independent protein translocase protein TatB [Acinetobacter sp. ANC 5378]NNG80933.1 twin-arginine translocase subunit TatB [Acinetobacter sp. ANC 5378]